MEGTPLAGGTAMDTRTCFLAAALALPLSSLAADEITSLHPEQAYPDDLPRMTSPGAFSGMISDVQRSLHKHGFDAGPVNGDLGSKTQAALAQFQLANDLPASGMLDAETLRALDVPLVDQAMAPGAAEQPAEASAAEAQPSTGR
jgi:peptidoglycan hydrolase-like protein with peptidoglycan-binding domain